MKAKRILAAAFAALMASAALVLSGCGSKDNNDETEESGVVMLNMFVITSEETGAKAKLDVQKAINEVTVPNEKILVKMNFLSPEEYWDAVNLAEYQTATYATTRVNPYAAANKERKMLSDMNFNEVIDFVFGMEDLELERPQIDIFVVDDYDTFVSLAEDGRLAEIDTKYDRKTITKYLHPTLLATTTVNRRVYGIPANAAMDGTYKFLVFNKDLLDKYGYNVTDLRKVEEMGDYLAAVKAGEPGVYPLSDVPEYAGAEIFDNVLFAQSGLTNIASGAFPVYLNNPNYMNYLNKTSDFRAAGYVAAFDGVSHGPYAVEYVESTTLLDHEWTDENGVTYQAYLYDIPRVTAADAFKSAMVVSAYSFNRAKAAELIELFNTDAELANLLQYGIEGIHYRVEDDVVSFIDTDKENTYRMDPFLTGNLYIRYITEDMADYVKAAKASNLASAPSAFFGFDVKFDDKASEAVYDCVKTFSADALDRVARGEMTTDEVFNIASRELNALGCKWDASGANLLGVFGKISAQVKNNAADIAANFTLGEEAKTYNDVYKTKAEIEAEIEAEKEAEAEAEAEREAAAEAELEARIEAENAANAPEEEEEAAEENAEAAED